MVVRLSGDIDDASIGNPIYALELERVVAGDVAGSNQTGRRCALRDGDGKRMDVLNTDADADAEEGK